MLGKNRMVQLGIMLGLILALTGLDWSYGAVAADQGPDQAMRSFIDAVVRKDKSAILSSFSPTSPWQYVGYEIGTGKVIATAISAWNMSCGGMGPISIGHLIASCFSSFDPHCSAHAVAWSVASLCAPTGSPCSSPLSLIASS